MAPPYVAVKNKNRDNRRGADVRIFPARFSDGSEKEASGRAGSASIGNPAVHLNATRKGG